MNAKTASAVTIPRATYASIVTERLRASIVNGTVEPGSQLSEVELATSFGVSRGPVREALQRNGITAQATRCEPSASTASHAVSAESIPPERPIRTRSNVFLST